MQTLNADKLKILIESASNKLFNNKERIDALNIFPVPDGDTGTNMSSTFQKAVQIIEKESFDTTGELIEIVSKNMLLFARGNSGVILSQIFKGFSNAWNSLNNINIENFIKGFSMAAKTAYDSVLKPVEGTILTVIRETAEELAKIKVTKNSTFSSIMSIAVKTAQASLKNTPNLLPVLKEVGVVDSGGEGLLMILEGMKSAIEGNKVEIDLNSTKPLVIASNTEVYSGEFGYCTEVIIKLNEPDKFIKNKFVSQIEKLGNSMVIVNDGNLLKLHIHTITPGKILNIGQKVGEFLTVKIENMTEQANNTKSNLEGIKNYEITKVQPNKKNAIISCNAGSGFINIMKELECDYVIEGGQSNNPSAQDIIEAINIVNAENIIILPNNSNIILAAQQASKIKSDRNIKIIPTKSQVEGITAIMNYSSELDIEDNIEEIESSLKNLIVGEVVKAIKNTKIDNVKIKEGSYLMVMSHKIIGTKKNSLSASTALIDKMIKSNKKAQILIIYYGNNVSEIDAKKIEKYVLDKYDIEVQIQNGDQHIYDYMFGLE